jgi:hypothetical protein
LPAGRFGAAAEKVAENILEDLFTMVLDWRVFEVNNHTGYADIVLTRLDVKCRVKRPGARVDLVQLPRRPRHLCAGSGVPDILATWPAPRTPPRRRRLGDK